MNKEIQYLITTLQNTLFGEPWYGRAAFSLLEEVDPSTVYIKPRETNHSLIDLLYHMITWAEFTLRRLEKKQDDMKVVEQLDWRAIDPVEHTWEKGMGQFKQIHEQIIEVLHTKEDSFLKEIADYREYNFRFLLHGLIQHNIYHIGQVAYVYKLIGS
jgi:uncharacterized damage-inducible protein DinB